jgi:putative transposase
MARPLRIEREDGLYHVTSRGNARQRVFHDRQDFQRRCEWLRRTVEVYGWRLHAFALMSNHDHLFVETPRANLAAGMQFLNGSYTSDFNRRHRRTGHLFGGRYKAVLIEGEGHYWEVSRYIHLNPVRAGLCLRPEQWPWSSYGGYWSARRCVPWVTYERVLAEFGADAASARRAYRRFVEEGRGRPPDSPLSRAVAGLVLGSKQFVQQIRASVGRRPSDTGIPALRQLREGPSLERIVEVVAGHFGEDPTCWRSGRRDDSPARAVAAYLARCRFGHSAVRTAAALGYAAPSSVTRALQRAESELGRLASVVSILEREAANH